MAFIHEMRSAQAVTAAGSQYDVNATDLFLLSISRQNFSAILNALVKMEQYWAGATYVVNILERRSGISRPRTYGANRKTFISLPDKGMLRRFTAGRSHGMLLSGIEPDIVDPAHPRNIKAPTETSLRDSLTKPNPDIPSVSTEFRSELG